MQLTECKANHFKTEMDRLRERHMKTENEKAELEKKIQDADFYVHQLTMEKDKREAEAEKLKKELICAKLAEREATARLLNFLNRGIQASTENMLMRADSVSSNPSITENNSSTDLENAAGAVELNTVHNGENSSISESADDEFGPKEFILTENEMEQITNEIERNRLEYIKKSKQVQNQLQTLRSEIELLKIEENQSNLDILSAAQIKAGETKYSTLKKLKSGSTKARVAFFEEL